MLVVLIGSHFIGVTDVRGVHILHSPPAVYCVILMVDIYAHPSTHNINKCVLKLIVNFFVGMLESNLYLVKKTKLNI